MNIIKHLQINQILALYNPQEVDKSVNQQNTHTHTHT